MPSYRLVFLIGKLAVLAYDALRNPNLPDIMKKSRIIYLFALLLVLPAKLRKASRNFRNP